MLDIMTSCFQLLRVKKLEVNTLEVKKVEVKKFEAGRRNISYYDSLLQSSWSEVETMKAGSHHIMYCDFLFPTFSPQSFDTYVYCNNPVYYQTT